MSARSKDKGTAAESAVVAYLRAAGYVHAERRASSGAKDRGDIAGVYGLVIEVKDCARMELGAWIGEAIAERENDHAVWGVVWHKRRGTTDPGRWFVSMDGETFTRLITDALGGELCTPLLHGNTHNSQGVRP
jgi:hypothetical protein